MRVMSHILASKQQQCPLLALLIDPDKQAYEPLLSQLEDVDLIFVGGSTGQYADACVAMLREHTSRPIVLFPGNIEQFTPRADALLFLTLLNARTPEVLIQPHIAVARQVAESRIESIPLGYILVDGARKSSVEIATRCIPLAQDDLSQIIATAVAGELLGKELIYLEAGSGAQMPVGVDVVRAVRQHLSVPLIVGGGIRTPKAMLAAYEAGADIVVIGNHFEQNPHELRDFVRIKREKYGH